MVPFWVLDIIRHLVFRGPKGDHNFENHPYTTNDQGHLQVAIGGLLLLLSTSELDPSKTDRGSQLSEPTILLWLWTCGGQDPSATIAFRTARQRPVSSFDGPAARPG